MKRIVLILTLMSVVMIGCEDDPIEPMTPEDTTPPKVVSVSPEKNSEDVSVNVKIFAVFSEKLSSKSNSNWFTLTADSKECPGTVNVKEDTILFVTNSLEYETEYTAHISADVADEAENHLEESYSWNFTTSKKPDTTPPQIIEGGPLAENHNVSVIAEIEITFNEIIDTANLYIVPDDNPDLKIEGIIGETGHETTFNFENSLEYSTEYTAYLSATDLAGNEAEYSWTFTTKEHMVISTYPEDGEENVMRGYLVISAVFGESFDTASLYVTPTNNPDLKIEGIVKETPWNWDRISYDFSYLLEYSTEYTAYLSVTDLAGNEISYSWNFTTQENMVASTYPENGAENVSVNIETIRVEFKDLIVDAEIFCGYSWENPDGSTSSKSIQGDVIIDGKTITLTVEFPLRLRYSTKYSGFVILKNIEGNNIFSYEWFFTTEENPGE